MHSDIAERTTTRLAVDLRRLSWIRRLAADYAHEFGALERCFSGDPASHEAWERTISRAQHYPRDRERIAALLIEQQTRRHAPSAAAAASARLRNPQTVAIVTGQQAGLFGGPLFTLLKAITTLQLAASVEARYGIPVVPIFWVDSEDHDWEEVSSCTVLGSDSEPHSVSLPLTPDSGVPVSAVLLDDSIVSTTEAVERVLPPTEFTAWLSGALRKVYRPHVGMAEAFSGWLEQLLGPQSLVVFDASDPNAKRLVKNIFKHEMEAPGLTSRLASRAGAALEANGYHAQVSPAPDSVALFRLDDARRRRGIRLTDADVSSREKEAAALVQEIDEHAERFSPNVLLRPIVQDALFPTVSYVAGPNELAYLAQLRDVYTRFDVPMPLFYQRASATVLDTAAMRFISRYKVPFQALQAQDEGALNRLLESQLPANVEEALRTAESEVTGRMNTLIQALPSLDPTLEGAARSTLSRIDHQLQTLRGKIIQSAKRRDETLRRQFNGARAQAFPRGQPQERALGFISFLNRYGPSFIDQLKSELPLDMGYHWVLAF